MIQLLHIPPKLNQQERTFDDKRDLFFFFPSSSTYFTLILQSELLALSPCWQMDLRLAGKKPTAHTRMKKHGKVGNPQLPTEEH